MWSPRSFQRYVRTIRSSSRPAYIYTDAGAGYLKVANNPEGPHILACDWFGTQLARRFNISTFDVAMLNLEESDEIPLGDKTTAAAGLAFISRAEEGGTMGGSKTLESVENLEDIPRIVVFDTWVRNCDRFCPMYTAEGKPRINPDNIFFSVEGGSTGKFILKAIDHGHIFSCGKPLSTKLCHIENVREHKLYGLFPEFRKYVSIEQFDEIAKEFGKIDARLWDDLLEKLPTAWGITTEIRQSINQFLLDRAYFLEKNLHIIANAELHDGMLNFNL